VHGGFIVRATRRSAAPRRHAIALRASASHLSREAILEAAERVFGRAGFGAAKMTDIAREAGMAAGTLYNYFDSKERIFRSLLEARGAAHVAALATEAKRDAAPIDRLRGMIVAGMRWLEAHRAMFAIYVELGAMAEWSIGRIGGAKAETHYEEILRLFERVVREGIVAGELRRDVPAADQVAFLTGATNGFVRAWLVRGGKKTLAATAPLIFDLYLDGMRARA
jgi:TetR/AcrR family fatty acid metabolism transcriptional regulator